MADQELDLSEYNGASLVAASITFLALSWISVLLRGYVRLFMTKGFQLDDWFMVIAQVCVITGRLDLVDPWKHLEGGTYGGFQRALGLTERQIIFTLSCTFILLGVGRGLGQHNAALDQDAEIDSLMVRPSPSSCRHPSRRPRTGQLMDHFQWQALATATYVIDMMFIKLSIGVFLLRLAVQNAYRYILWGSLVVVSIWSTVLFFWNIFQCDPVAAQWDYTLENEKCVSVDEIVSAAYALSVMTILSDWLYVGLPGDGGGRTSVRVADGRRRCFRFRCFGR